MMKSNTIVSFEISSPVKTFAKTGPDPKVDRLLTRIMGKTPNRIISEVEFGRLTLADLELVRYDVHHNRPQTNINRMIVASVSYAIAELKGNDK
ncbi:hypothetical protein AB6V67_20200 [Serratia marcescens]|uniref:hypothetical protein n=1 Tax=Serratia TaxID=613 RepID=UPI0006DAE33E|nr:MULTISPECIES: hypothetical protein [Serratia]MBJ2082585.1 hypothetical protein [Serratia ureilytica]MDP8729474.1 hypothetical protein [Serratia marcescens]OCN28195.1 hypothetical protein AN699_0228880 [Serratia marcescens]OCN29781.1 hypothetical protein AN701_0228890 [Serratia marcescens]OCN49469.1 hypothetical protein AN658_0229015 [Serratia marcescens]